MTVGTDANTSVTPTSAPAGAEAGVEEVVDKCVDRSADLAVFSGLTDLPDVLEADTVVDANADMDTDANTSGTDVAAELMDDTAATELLDGLCYRAGRPSGAEHHSATSTYGSTLPYKPSSVSSTTAITIVSTDSATDKGTGCYPSTGQPTIALTDRMIVEAITCVETSLRKHLHQQPLCQPLRGKPLGDSLVCKPWHKSQCKRPGPSGWTKLGDCHPPDRPSLRLTAASLAPFSLSPVDRPPTIAGTDAGIGGSAGSDESCGGDGHDGDSGAGTGITAAAGGENAAKSAAMMAIEASALDAMVWEILRQATPRTPHCDTP